MAQHVADQHVDHERRSQRLDCAPGPVEAHEREPVHEANREQQIADVADRHHRPHNRRLARQQPPRGRADERGGRRVHGQGKTDHDQMDPLQPPHEGVAAGRERLPHRTRHQIRKPHVGELDAG